MTGNYRVEHPHNEHLEILHDGGIIGYGLFVWMMIEVLLLLLRRKTLIATGVAVSLFGLLLDGLFSQNLRQIAPEEEWIEPVIDQINMQKNSS